MHQDSSLLGKSVEVIYCFGAIQLLAVGLLLAYSDDSILLEQQADQYGPVPAFQVRILYSCIVRLREAHPQSTVGSGHWVGSHRMEDPCP